MTCTCRQNCPCTFCFLVRKQWQGRKPKHVELDRLALNFILAWEWYSDRCEDHRMFGTPFPTMTIN